MNIIDKTVGFFSPAAGTRRLVARANMMNMETQIRKYEGAADGRRHSNWLMRTNPSVNQLINKDLKNLVARSRELTINNGYARKVPYSIANSVVGTGIVPKPVIADIIEKGTIKEVPNKETILAMVQAAWNEFANELSCDYNNDFNFYGIQYLVMRTIITSGEVLVMRKRVTSDINKYGFQYLVLEGDYIDSTKESEKDPDGGYTMGGVKYDRNFKRSGYWIFDRHPSEGTGTSTFVELKELIHIYDIERAGQSRGVPSNASTLLKQRDLDDYEDAELLGKKVSACMPIFVTNADPETKLADGENQIETIEPGAINYLQSGEQVTFATPPSNSGFPEFTKTQRRAIASGNLITYEMATGDYSNVNFSSGRMGWIEYSRQVDNWQYLMMIPKFCDKAFAWFAESLQVVQSLKAEIVIKAEWTAPRREMIDPVKETGAKKTAMRSGLMSWQETVKADGYDPKKVLQEMAEDQAAFIKAGLMPDYTQYFELMAKLQQKGADTSAAEPAKK